MVIPSLEWPDDIKKPARLETYDAFVDRLSRFPSSIADPDLVGSMYCALGLVGEAGEVSEKIKKWHRDGVIDHEAVAKELGDVLYYLTRLSHFMGYTLPEIQQLNKEKLTKRLKENKIHGSGDNR